MVISQDCKTIVLTAVSRPSNFGKGISKKCWIINVCTFRHLELLWYAVVTAESYTLEKKVLKLVMDTVGAGSGLMQVPLVSALWSCWSVCGNRLLYIIWVALIVCRAKTGLPTHGSHSLVAAHQHFGHEVGIISYKDTSNYLALELSKIKSLDFTSNNSARQDWNYLPIFYGK